MYRAVPYALAAMAVFAIVAVMASPVDPNHIISVLGSAFTSAVDQSREFCRRTLMSIPFEYSLMDRARVLAVKQFHTVHHVAEEVLVRYIDGCRRFITNAIEGSHFFRSAKGSRLPQPSIESITYHPQPGSYPQYGSHFPHGSYAWGILPAGLHRDPIPNTSTLVFVVVTNLCTVVLCISIISAISISSAILAALRLVWRSTKGLVRLPARPKVTWETILQKFCHFLAKLAAGGFNMLVVCLASLMFCIVNTIVWAANLNIGFKLARLEIPPPQVIYRTLEDPRVPKLQEENRWLYNEVADKVALLESTRARYDTDLSQRDREIETLDDANMAQKAVILGQNKMLASIDMTRSIYDQLKEKEKRADDLQKEKDLAVEDKKQSEAYYSKQFGGQFETIRSLRWELKVEKQEHALLRKEHACCQGRLDSSEAMSKLHEKSQRKRIQDLEKSMASKEETLNALLKERDELINTQQKASQDLEARMKKQKERHVSQKKSEFAYLKREFYDELKERTKDCERSSAARKTAEAALEAERKGRKAAEDELTAEKVAREAAQQQAAADSKALEEAKAEVAKKEEQIKQKKDAHNSAKGKLNAEILARQSASQEIAWLTRRLATGRPSSDDKGTRTSKPPPSRGKIPPVSRNGAEVPDMRIFNFGSSTASGIFGVDPSPKPETPPTGPSLPELSRGEDTSDESSSDSSDIEEPEADNTPPAEGSPAEPASPSGEQPEPSEQPETPEQPEASEPTSA